MKNGKKPKTGAEAGASSGAAAVCIGTPQTIKMEELTSSRLNVHRTRGDEQIKGLAESIRKNGLIQRVVVRPDGDGGYVVVDGHRRVQAARMIGWTQIPVDVIDPDEAGVLARMVAANVQRIPNDPILEAEAIERMAAEGMSRAEIAASIGKDASYVARRARLMSLTKPWRDFARRVPCTTDLLERVAAHEEQLQIRVAADVGLDEYENDLADDSRCTWQEFEDTFMRDTMVLENAQFDTTACAKCPNNTACHEYLFDFLEDEDGRVARCQDAACYARKASAEVDALVARLRKTSTPAIEVADKWRIPESWSARTEMDKGHPQAYVFTQDGVRRVLWSVPPPKKANAALTKEEREERKAAKRRNVLMSSARGKVRRLLRPGGDGRIAFFDDGGDAAEAYNFIALSRLERDLSRDYIPDCLVDEVVRVCRRIPAMREALDADELKAYLETFDAEDEAGKAQAGGGR